MLQNVYISLPYILAARTASIDLGIKKLRHCWLLYYSVVCFLFMILFVTRKHRQSYQHAYPRRVHLIPLWPWPFDLKVSACRGPAMDYLSTDFGADSSSLPLERGQTDKQTDRRDWTPYPTLAAIQPAWVTTRVVRYHRMYSKSVFNAVRQLCWFMNIQTRNVLQWGCHLDESLATHFMQKRYFTTSVSRVCDAFTPPATPTMLL